MARGEVARDPLAQLLEGATIGPGVRAARVHRARQDDVEAAVALGRAVRVERDRRVRVRLVADPGPLVHARAPRAVAVLGQLDRGALLLQQRRAAGGRRRG